MTGAEFKTIRESLGLSAQALADILGVSQERTIRRWEDGSRAVPVGAAERLLALDQWADTLAANGYTVIQGSGAAAVVLLRYETEEDLRHYRPQDAAFPHANRVHAAALGRLRRLAPDAVRLLSMDAGAYEAWRGNRKDSEALRAQWAAEQI